LLRSGGANKKPVVTFVLTMATQWIMLLAGSAYLSMTGRSAAALWQLPWLQILSGVRVSRQRCRRIQ